jgi:hypothetical protein
MADAGGLPTRSRIEDFDQTADVLSQTAAYLRSGAGRLQRATKGYVEQTNRPNGSEWQGLTATHYFAQAKADQLVAFPAVDHAQALADVAEHGADALRGSRAAALEAISQAEDDEFTVGEDLSVSDNYAWESPADQAVRQQAAVAHRNYIAHCAGRLQAENIRIADQLNSGAAQLTAMIPADWQQPNNGRVQAVDSKTLKDAPGQDDDEDKKHGGGKSIGKGSKTQIETHGDTEQQWGHPTAPHEVWPNVPHKTGTFDGDHGKWEWHGPGWQGEAYGSQHTDGITGKADAGAWLGKGEASWSRNLFGNPLTTSGNAEVGVHAGADAAITDHGVSLGGDAFGGAEIGGKVDYNLGPVDLSLGGAAQAGAGATAHLDIGMEDDKFVLGATLGEAWGLGGKVSPHIAIDPNLLVNGVTKAGQWLSDLFN